VKNAESVAKKITAASSCFSFFLMLEGIRNLPG